MSYILHFLLWSFIIYWSHRAAHWFDFYSLHAEHHRLIAEDIQNKSSWKTMLLWLDNWKVTVDTWIIEVIPTIIFCWAFGQWWIFILYWVWTAIIQESVEHNERISLYPFLTSGKWHLIHHKEDNKNFGLFIPCWDILFKTNKPYK